MKFVFPVVRASLILGALFAFCGCEQTLPTASEARYGANSLLATAASNGPFAYVANQTSGTVSVIATASNTVVATIAVGNTPCSVAITTNGEFAYVTNYYSGTVSVIATASNAVVATIAAGSTPLAIRITPNGEFVYVTNQRASTVTVIATVSNEVVATIALGSLYAQDIAMTPDGAFAYVTTLYGNSVAVINAATHTLVTSIDVGRIAQDIVITPNGAFAYVTNNIPNSVSVIAMASNTVVATIDVAGYPTGVAIAPNGAFVYVTNLFGNSVAVIATATNTVVATIDVGPGPMGIAITPDGAFAYVGNYGNGQQVDPTTVAVIATASRTVVATIGVGTRPAYIAVTPQQRDVTAPTTTISSAEDGTGAAIVGGSATLSRTIAFVFDGRDDVGVLGFECSLDSAPYVVCSTTATYSALALGTRSFRVRAVDAAGNVSVPANFTWTVVTPSQAIQNLINDLANMGLPPGVANSLTASLKNINTTNSAAACGKLNAFVNQVKAKTRNGQLSASASIQLLHAAKAVMASLDCP